MLSSQICKNSLSCSPGESKKMKKERRGEERRGAES